MEKLPVVHRPTPGIRGAVDAFASCTTRAEFAACLETVLVTEYRDKLDSTSIKNKRVKPAKYLVPGRVPLGKLIICCARGGLGKSTLWRSVGADVSCGRCALGLTYENPIRAKVLIVAAEDDPEDTIRFYALRLREAGMIKSSPNRIIAEATDWRFLNELKRELKG